MTIICAIRNASVDCCSNCRCTWHKSMVFAKDIDQKLSKRITTTISTTNNMIKEIIIVSDQLVNAIILFFASFFRRFCVSSVSFYVRFQLNMSWTQFKRTVPLIVSAGVCAVSCPVAKSIRLNESAFHATKHITIAFVQIGWQVD